MEAVLSGTETVWGAIGFRNGGGSDTQARTEAIAKCTADLCRALSERHDIKAFVFFTNVDLTPKQKNELSAIAAGKGITHFEVFDYEILRHALDTPEGMIPRLQYLKISMSETEQLALVSKFGGQLQQAVVQRFDRVEETLSKMDTFIAMQKPISRIDVYVQLRSSNVSRDIGDELILLEIGGLGSIGDAHFVLVKVVQDHISAGTHLVTKSYAWLTIQKSVIEFPNTVGAPGLEMRAFTQVEVFVSGQRVRLADIGTLTLKAYMTPEIMKLACQITLEVNGFECCIAEIVDGGVTNELSAPDNLAIDLGQYVWHRNQKVVRKELLFHTPRLSGRLSELRPFNLQR